MACQPAAIPPNRASAPHILVVCCPADASIARRLLTHLGVLRHHGAAIGELTVRPYGSTAEFTLSSDPHTQLDETHLGVLLQGARVIVPLLSATFLDVVQTAGPRLCDLLVAAAGRGAWVAPLLAAPVLLDGSGFDSEDLEPYNNTARTLVELRSPQRDRVMVALTGDVATVLQVIPIGRRAAGNTGGGC